MKKQVILRGLFGAPIGLFITTAIAIGISYSVGNGNFYPVAPALAEHCGSELNAVFFQTVMSLLYGAVFGGASAIWEMERWSLLRQTVTHLDAAQLGRLSGVLWAVPCHLRRYLALDLAPHSQTSETHQSVALKQNRTGRIVCPLLFPVLMLNEKGPDKNGPPLQRGGPF